MAEVGWERVNVYGPVTAGEMLRRTFRLLGESPGLFFGIAALLIGVELIIGGVMGAGNIVVTRSGAATGAAAVARVLVMFPLTMLGVLLVIVFTQIVQGALFVAARARLGGVPITVGEACSVASQRAGRLVGISLLVAVRMFGYILLMYVGLALVVVLPITLIPGIGHWRREPGFNSGHAISPAHVVLYGVLGLLFVVVVGLIMLWLYARYALAIPAALEEDVSITESIRRSIGLSHGSKGRLYALFLAAAGLYLAIFACLLPVELMAMHTGSMAPGRVSGAVVLLGVFQYMVSAAVLAFVSVGISICYFDLRARKEGLGEPPAGGFPAPEQIG